MVGSLSPPAAPPRGRPPSRAEVAAALGLSVIELDRFAAARRRAAGPKFELADLPFVPIVDGPSRGWHYRLDAPELSRLPLGLMWIGEGGRRDGGGSHRDRSGRLEGRLGIHHFDEVIGERPTARKPPPKFRPKRPRRKKDRVA
jgi:hypothetical protein